MAQIEDCRLRKVIYRMGFGEAASFLYMFLWMTQLIDTTVATISEYSMDWRGLSKIPEKLNVCAGAMGNTVTIPIFTTEILLDAYTSIF